MVSLFSRALEALHEVKWLLTLSTDLFMKCLLFLQKSFHSHVLMGLEEFPAYVSNVIVAPHTGALVEDLSTGMCPFLLGECWQAVRNVSFYFTIHFFFFR